MTRHKIDNQRPHGDRSDVHLVRTTIEMVHHLSKSPPPPQITPPSPHTQSLYCPLDGSTAICDKHILCFYLHLSFHFRLCICRPVTCVNFLSSHRCVYARLLPLISLVCVCVCFTGVCVTSNRFPICTIRGHHPQ